MKVTAFSSIGDLISSPKSEIGVYHDEDDDGSDNDDVVVIVVVVSARCWVHISDILANKNRSVLCLRMV